MEKYDQHFIQEMKSKLEVELIGVASIERSTSKTYRQVGLTCGVCMKVCDNVIG